MKYIASWVIALTLIVVCHTWAVEKAPSGLTEAQIKITRDGLLLHKVSMLLVDGKEASVTFSDDKSNRPLTRLMVTSSKKDWNGKTLINMEVVWLSYNNGRWLTESKASVLNEAGKEGVVSLVSDTGTQAISVVAKPGDKIINPATGLIIPTDRTVHG